MKFKIRINEASNQLDESLNSNIRKKLSNYSDSQIKKALVDLFDKKDKTPQETVTYSMLFSELEQRYTDAGKLDEFDKWVDGWYK